MVTKRARETSRLEHVVLGEACRLPNRRGPEERPHNAQAGEKHEGRAHRRASGERAPRSTRRAGSPSGAPQARTRVPRAGTTASRRGRSPRCSSRRPRPPARSAGSASRSCRRSRRRRSGTAAVRPPRARAARRPGRRAPHGSSVAASRSTGCRGGHPPGRARASASRQRRGEHRQPDDHRGERRLRRGPGGQYRATGAAGGFDGSSLSVGPRCPPRGGVLSRPNSYPLLGLPASFCLGTGHRTPATSEVPSKPLEPERVERLRARRGDDALRLEVAPRASRARARGRSRTACSRRTGCPGTPCTAC